MIKMRNMIKTASKKLVAGGLAVAGGTSLQASAITDAVAADMTAAETDLGLVFIAIVGVIIAIAVFRFIRGAIH